MGQYQREFFKTLFKDDCIPAGTITVMLRGYILPREYGVILLKIKDLCMYYSGISCISL
jgi:hypothetical protein